MSHTPLGRRAFLRRATLAAGAAGGLSALTGCGDDPVRPPTPPATPTDLSARAVTAFLVELSWSDRSDDETGFEVERKNASAAEFVRIAAVPADSTVYRDDTVSESVMYQYRVRATRDGVFSGYSAEVPVQTPAALAPAAPADLSVSEVTETGALLSWSDAADNEIGFRIQLRGQSGTVTEVATLDADTTEFRVDALAPRTLHRFYVEAFNESGTSGASNEVSVYTGPVSGDLKATVTAPGTVKIEWTDRTSGAVSFRVERSLDSGAFVQVAVVPAGGVMFTDGAVPEAALYAYRVVGAGILGVDTDPVSLTAPNAPPGRPEGLVAGADPLDGGRILLTWSASGSVDGFVIDRSTGGAFSMIGATGATTAFADTPTPLLPFTYRVRAFNLLAYSTPSESVTARARAVVLFAGLPAQNDLRIVGRGTRLTLAGVPPRTFSPALTFSCGSLPSYIHLVRITSTGIAAVLGNCTHQCCTTNYRANTSSPPDGTLSCPCHGSVFRLDGTVQSGPATVSEPVFPTVIFEDRVEILAPGETVPAALAGSTEQDRTAEPAADGDAARKE